MSWPLYWSGDTMVTRAGHCKVVSTLTDGHPRVQTQSSDIGYHLIISTPVTFPITTSKIEHWSELNNRKSEFPWFWVWSNVSWNISLWWRLSWEWAPWPLACVMSHVTAIGNCCPVTWLKYILMEIYLVTNYAGELILGRSNVSRITCLLLSRHRLPVCVLLEFQHFLLWYFETQREIKRDDSWDETLKTNI